MQVESVKVPGGEIAVRGISLVDITNLMVAGNRADLEAAVEQMKELYEAAKANDEDALAEGLMTIATKLPNFVAKLIAGCADEPESWEVVKKLGISVQLEALQKIGHLTFDGDDALKNFVSGLTMLLNSITRATNSLNSQIASPGTKSLEH
jgi:hypothetical protein